MKDQALTQRPDSTQGSRRTDDRKPAPSTSLDGGVRVKFLKNGTMYVEIESGVKTDPPRQKRRRGDNGPREGGPRFGPFKSLTLTDKEMVGIGDLGVFGSYRCELVLEPERQKREETHAAPRVATEITQPPPDPPDPGSFQGPGGAESFFREFWAALVQLTLTQPPPDPPDPGSFQAFGESINGARR